MYEELVRALRRCSYTTVAGCDREDGYCKPCAYFISDKSDVTCIDMMMIDAADAIEDLQKEIERLKPLVEEWEKVKQANLIAWRTAWDECYGENGTQRWDKNPDIKVFKDEN